MNKKYVVNKEIAVRMRDLGFPQESEFYWVLSLDKYIIVDKENAYTDFDKGLGWMTQNTTYSAYLTGELGEMLLSEKALLTTRINGEVGISNTKTKDFVFYQEDTEANARGLMACYLKENKLLEVKDEA